MSIAQKRKSRVALVVIATLGIALLAVYGAVALISERVKSALGPRATMREIHVGWSGIQIRDLHIAGPKGWPRPDVLAARSVVVRPELHSLLPGAPIAIASIAIEDGLVTCVREARGHVPILPLLPSLRDGEPGEPGEAATAEPPIAIHTIDAQRMRVEIYDASVRSPPYELILDPVLARFENISVPVGDGRVNFTVRGTGPGAQNTPAAGAFEVRGWIEPGPRNSQIATELHGAPLAALQPYLLKSSDSGIAAGSLDLSLAAHVQGGVLHAPGTLTLSGLELGPSGHGPQTFMGLSREVLVKAMEDRHGQIVTRFTLAGNLDDPRFSLNEDLAMRTSTALAEVLGVSVSTIATTVGSAGETGVGLAGKIVQGAADVAKQLLGK